MTNFILFHNAWKLTKKRQTLDNIAKYFETKSWQTISQDMEDEDAETLAKENLIFFRHRPRRCQTKIPSPVQFWWIFACKLFPSIVSLVRMVRTPFMQDFLMRVSEKV